MELGDAMTFSCLGWEVEWKVALGGGLHGVTAGRGYGNSKGCWPLKKEWGIRVCQVDRASGVGCHGGCARDRGRRRDSVGVVTVVRC